MKTGVEYCEEKGLRFDQYPDGSIPLEEFEKRGIPMVVACTHCTSTMAFPSCVIENGCIYCQDCAECFEQSVDTSQSKFELAFNYLANWPQNDYGSDRYVNWPEYEYNSKPKDSGFIQYAGTNGIHRNDPGKTWKVGPFKTAQECIIALSELLPTVNTESDYNV